MRRVGLVALAALAACATVGDRLPPPPPPSFRHVKTLVLVRTAEDRAGRAKDPLDALDESLRARGYGTRVVELAGGRSPEQAALARLYAQLEARAGAAQGERLGTPPYGDAGGDAGAAVAGLGVDAVAAYHRLEGRRPLPSPAPSQPALPGTVMPPQPTAPTRGPIGALSVVDREGHVASFAWGQPTALDDPDVPVNAAEAVDLVVRTLAGEPEE
jgi:hypothetical protein